METGQVKSKGQLEIPAKLRKKFGIKEGTRISFYEEKDGIRIVPLTLASIDANKGFLRTGEKLLKSLMAEKKKEH